MNIEQDRFYHCRNRHCRSKLAQPVEIHRHAFCSRNCFVRFYRYHCLVCGNAASVVDAKRVGHIRTGSRLQRRGA
jgi:hypothetical protein